MTDQQALERGCARLGITPDKVMAWAVRDGNLIMVVWPGPKHIIPLAELPEPQAPELPAPSLVVEAVPVDRKPRTRKGGKR
jgi:hypothetical protein